jgi:hypothetical protein
LGKSKFTNREETQRHLKICLSLKSHLQKKNLLVHREWYLILDNEDRIIGIPTYEITHEQKSRKEKYRNPDLMWWNDGLWILEVDGLIHRIKSHNTEKRDRIYQNNNCKYIVIETFDEFEKPRKIDDMIDELDKKITLLTNTKNTIQ